MCVTEEDFSMPPARSSGVWPRLRYASVAGQQWCVRLARVDVEQDRFKRENVCMWVGGWVRARARHEQ